MIKPRDSMYLMEILKLTQSKSRKIRRYGKIAGWLFKLSNYYKQKAEMLVLSGGKVDKFQKKVKKTMGTLDEIKRNTMPITITGDPDRLSGLTEPKSATYQEARNRRERIELVPAKPGFFKMTDDVPQEKRDALEKEQVSQKNEHGLTEEERRKKALARKFYYKRKRKKFDPKKFNQQKKEN